jgi:hypothetical protein
MPSLEKGIISFALLFTLIIIVQPVNTPRKINKSSLFLARWPQQ